MLEARLGSPGDLAFVQAATLAAYSVYLPILGAMPLLVDADHAAAIALGQVWLVRDGQADAGLLVLETAPAYLMIESLVVLPAHQGQGLGRWMLSFAEQHALSIGLPELRLYTNAKMSRNIRMYGLAGFIETDRQPTPHRTDSIRVYMTKRLDDQAGQSPAT